MYFRDSNTGKTYSNKELIALFSESLETDFQKFKGKFLEVAPRAQPKKNPLADDIQEVQVVEWKSTKEWAEIDAENLRLAKEANDVRNGLKSIKNKKGD